MAEPTESRCALRFDPEAGFELDLDYGDDDLRIRMVRVPVPADGLIRLRETPIALYPLDTLFKTRVDVDDAPGQLNDVTVQLVAATTGPAMRVEATVEDAETGMTRPFSVVIVVDLPGAAPAAGGPVPEPPDEDALDWDDEQMMGDDDEDPDDLEDDDLSDESDELPPTPARGATGAARGAPEGVAKVGTKGLEALLRALMSGNGDEPAPAASAEPSTPEPEDDDEDDDVPPPSVPTGLLSADEEARSLLQFLVDQGHLELSDGARVDPLAPGVARVLARRLDSEGKATALSEWLIGQPQVEELYIDDDSLAELIEQW